MSQDNDVIIVKFKRFSGKRLTLNACTMLIKQGQNWYAY